MSSSRWTYDVLVVRQLLQDIHELLQSVCVGGEKATQREIDDLAWQSLEAFGQLVRSRYSFGKQRSVDLPEFVLLFQFFAEVIDLWKENR